MRENDRSQVLALLQSEPGCPFFVQPMLKALHWHFLSGARIYPALAGLERDGLVTSGWSAGSPRRRWYKAVAPRDS